MNVRAWKEPGLIARVVREQRNEFRKDWCSMYENERLSSLDPREAFPDFDHEEERALWEELRGDDEEEWTEFDIVTVEDVDLDSF